jgi:hypothetical protein
MLYGPGVVRLTAVDVFEYLLARLHRSMFGSQNPHQDQGFGQAVGSDCAEISRVLSVLASHGHEPHLGAGSGVPGRDANFAPENKMPQVGDWLKAWMPTCPV